MTFSLFDDEPGGGQGGKLAGDRTRPGLQTAHQLIERQPAIRVRVKLSQHSGARLAEKDLIEHGAPHLGLIAPNIGAKFQSSSGSLPDWDRLHPNWERWNSPRTALSWTDSTGHKTTGGREEVARPERFELPTNRFEAGYSIQLSYGRRTGIVT